MKQTRLFTPAALTLSVLTAVLAEQVPQGVSVRSALWAGAAGAAALCLLSALSMAAWQIPHFCTVWKVVLTVSFAAELARTFGQAQQVCVQEFSSMALVGFLPLLWGGWSIRPAQWNAPARVLWWFAALGAVICLAGLGGQMHWYRLPEFSGVHSTGTVWMVPLYAEYFALPFLCEAPAQRKLLWLPGVSFLVQAVVLTAGALLFGTEVYPQMELLRAWSTGSFSRMDAFLLLLWLLCAVYRMAVLCASIRLLWQPQTGQEALE
mgnify:CR=1 FL=1